MGFLFPKFVSSDLELNRTYQYRCELYQRHIKKVPSGYVITEFLPDVPWAQRWISSRLRTFPITATPFP